MLENLVRPDRSVMEIVLKLGNQARTGLDTDERGEGPPCLTIEDEAMSVCLYPHGWYEFGEVQQCDLDRAADLVIDATRYRDVLFRKLKALRADLETDNIEHAD